MERFPLKRDPDYATEAGEGKPRNFENSGNEGKFNFWGLCVGLEDFDVAC